MLKVAVGCAKWAGGVWQLQQRVHRERAAWRINLEYAQRLSLIPLIRVSRTA